MKAAFRHQEGLTQFADRGHFLFKDHLPIIRVHALTPKRTLTPFLINGYPLTQPTGHTVLSNLQSNDMTKLMPKHRLPIGGVSALRGRTIGCDQLPETHSQIPISPRHAKGPNRKILFVGENLNVNRLLQRQSVFAT